MTIDGNEPEGGHLGESSGPATGEAADSSVGAPDGDVYDWYRRGVELLEQKHPAAAEQLLDRAAAADPDSRSIREALARAQFDAGRYAAAADNFARIVEANPSDDYAQFGLGLAAERGGDFETAVEHLALAVAMRPELGHYSRALTRARAARDAGR
jgi:tetratricopeptide (TPR) repeat protein